MNLALYWLGNKIFRLYIRRAGREGAAATLIGTLQWLRSWAEAETLDFAAALDSSRRRGSEDWLRDR